ncbi:hypothetical protein [Moorena sp. SIO4G3]|nr:hypothetical protein [Moorena sp. SIO4G3]
MKDSVQNSSHTHPWPMATLRERFEMWDEFCRKLKPLTITITPNP